LLRSSPKACKGCPQNIETPEDSPELEAAIFQVNHLLRKKKKMEMKLPVRLMDFDARYILEIQIEMERMEYEKQQEIREKRSQ
jgi:hypothetical protein